jgi:hypothetical protein
LLNGNTGLVTAGGDLRLDVMLLDRLLAFDGTTAAIGTTPAVVDRGLSVLILGAVSSTEGSDEMGDVSTDVCSRESDCTHTAMSLSGLDGERLLIPLPPANIDSGDGLRLFVVCNVGYMKCHE